MFKKYDTKNVIIEVKYTEQMGNTPWGETCSELAGAIITIVNKDNGKIIEEVSLDWNEYEKVEKEIKSYFYIINPENFEPVDRSEVAKALRFLRARIKWIRSGWNHYDNVEYAPSTFISEYNRLKKSRAGYMLCSSKDRVVPYILKIKKDRKDVEPALWSRWYCD